MDWIFAAAKIAGRRGKALAHGAVTVEVLAVALYTIALVGGFTRGDGCRFGEQKGWCDRFCSRSTVERLATGNGHTAVRHYRDGLLIGLDGWGLPHASDREVIVIKRNHTNGDESNGGHDQAEG